MRNKMQNRRKYHASLVHELSLKTIISIFFTFMKAREIVRAIQVACVINNNSQ